MLGKVVRFSSNEKLVDVRGLHWYKTKDLNCKFVHRDSNAAKNIHLLHHFITTGLERPIMFQRTDLALPKQESKILQTNEIGLNLFRKEMLTSCQTKYLLNRLRSNPRN